MDELTFSLSAGRRFQRRQLLRPCRLSWPGRELFASTRDLSSSGVALTLSEDTDLKMKETAHIQFPNGIALRAVLVHARHEREHLIAGFQVEAIERGEQEWRDLYDRAHY